MGGGLGFMVSGHLCCSVSPRGLTVRVGPEGKQDALGRPNVGPHRVGRRETKAFVVVGPEGFEDEGLDYWLERAVRFVESLPVK